MRRRDDAFDLRSALRAANFTPRVQDAPALITLLEGGDEAAQEDAARALGRMELAAPLILARAAEAAPPLRGRLCRAVGQLAQRGVAGARELLVTRLGDEDDRARKAAIMALGHLPGPDVEDALLRAWASEARPEHRRALASALGKVGGGRALAALDEVGARALVALDEVGARAPSAQGEAGGAQQGARSEPHGDDPELRRIAERASLMIERTEARQVPSRLRFDRAPPRPLAVLARCRLGLEAILAEELRERLGLVTRPGGPGTLALEIDQAPAALLQARTLLQVAFPLPAAPVAGGDVAEAVAEALTSPAAREIFFTFTEGPPRFRLAWAGGGHRRGLTWRVAALVQRRCPELRNDPTESTWEAQVREVRGGIEIALQPRRLPDERFAYRKGDVPAASHPTLAAALARAGGVDAADVVWDPFVGSGLELAERALLGPLRALHGTDVDPQALATARRNLDSLAAAGFGDATLTLADACAFDPGGVTLILTNPPMGRRVHRDGSLGALLDRFADHAARVLRPGGRLAWLSPMPQRTAERLRGAGLDVTIAGDVDMGGFFAQLQIARKGGR